MISLLTLISISISLNALWSKNVGLKSSDQGYICCTEDAETESLAQSSVVRGNYSQLVYSTSHVVLLFGRRKEEEKEKIKPTEKRREGRSSDEHRAPGSWYRRHSPSLRGCPGWPRPCPRPCHICCPVDSASVIRVGRECSVLTALCTPPGSPRVSRDRGQEREGSAWRCWSLLRRATTTNTALCRLRWGCGSNSGTTTLRGQQGKGLRLWDSLGTGAPSWERRQRPEGPTGDP